MSDRVSYLEGELQPKRRNGASADDAELDSPTWTNPKVLEMRARAYRRINDPLPEYCPQCGRSDCPGVNHLGRCQEDSESSENEDRYDYLDDIMGSGQTPEEPRVKKFRRNGGPEDSQ